MNECVWQECDLELKALELIQIRVQDFKKALKNDKRAYKLHGWQNIMNTQGKKSEQFYNW